MRAALNTRYGPPDVVRVVQVDAPAPGEHDILVQVHVTTVNRTDCGFRAAAPWFIRAFSGLVRPKFPVNGSEFAGVVGALGEGVTSFEVGDRVFGFSEDRFGAHAEYLTIREDGPVARIPPNVSFAEAAPSTEGSHYAWSDIRKAGIGSADHVLVNGATGAIGSAAVQLLVNLGASVTAVCDGRHAELVRGLGAERVIDRATQDFTKDDRLYDVVFDAVGKSSFRRCRHLLAPKGIYLSTDLGALSQNPFLAIVTRLFRGKRVMFPIPPKHDQEGIRRVGELLQSGAFRPVIDRRYPLDEIVEAYRYVETGRKIGNVLIDVVPAGEAGLGSGSDARELEAGLGDHVVP